MMICNISFLLLLALISSACAKYGDVHYIAERLWTPDQHTNTRELFPKGATNLEMHNCLEQWFPNLFCLAFFLQNQKI